jgi:hypothetical protein
METLPDEEGEGVLLGETLEVEEELEETSVVGERLELDVVVADILVL